MGYCLVVGVKGSWVRCCGWISIGCEFWIRLWFIKRKWWILRIWWVLFILCENWVVRGVWIDVKVSMCLVYDFDVGIILGFRLCRVIVFIFFFMDFLELVRRFLLWCCFGRCLDLVLKRYILFVFEVIEVEVEVLVLGLWRGWIFGCFWCYFLVFILLYFVLMLRLFLFWWWFLS